MNFPIPEKGDYAFSLLFQFNCLWKQSRSLWLTNERNLLGSNFQWTYRYQCPKQEAQGWNVMKLKLYHFHHAGKGICLFSYYNEIAIVSGMVCREQRYVGASGLTRKSNSHPGSFISQLYASYIMFIAFPFSHLVSMPYVPPSFQGIAVGLANYY